MGFLSLFLGCTLAANLKLDSKAGLYRCPDMSHCIFNDIMQGEVTEDGWIGCAAQCADHPECEYWTFVTAPVQNRACYLKSACPIPFTDSMLILGLRNVHF